MKSFNTGHECWWALSPSLKEEPLWFQVQSMASKEFVTGMDILIGSLTFGKTPSDNLMSQFFCPDQSSNRVFYTHTADNIFICTISTYYKWLYSQEYYMVPLFLPVWFSRKVKKYWCRFLWSHKTLNRLKNLPWSLIFKHVCRCAK